MGIYDKSIVNLSFSQNFQSSFISMIFPGLFFIKLNSSKELSFFQEFALYIHIVIKKRKVKNNIFAIISFREKLKINIDENKELFIKIIYVIRKRTCIIKALFTCECTK
jgi:hypothetical protein